MTGREEHEKEFKRKIENHLINMPDYVSEWYNNMVASDLTMQSCFGFIFSVEKYLNSINKEKKSIKLNELTPSSLDKHLISLKSIYDKNGNEVRKASDSNIVSAWMALNNFFKFLYRRHYIEKNYMEDIKRPKNRDLDRINEQRILLNKDDFANIIEAAYESDSLNPKRDVLILGLLMATGMRESALASINLEDIDIPNKKMYVIDKGGKRHEYVLSSNLIIMLEDYLDERYKFDPKMEIDALLISRYRKRISIGCIIYTVGHFTEIALGKKLSPHKLRAGFCSILYDEKHDIEFVRRAVGHSSSRVTQRYIVTDNSEKAEASAIIDKLF